MNRRCEVLVVGGGPGGSTCAGRVPLQTCHGFSARSGFASARVLSTPRLGIAMRRADALAVTAGDCTGPSLVSAVPSTSQGIVYVTVFPFCCWITTVAFVPMLVARGYQAW